MQVVDFFQIPSLPEKSHQAVNNNGLQEIPTLDNGKEVFGTWFVTPRDFFFGSC
jgi:hypothetical protein